MMNNNMKRRLSDIEILPALAVVFFILTFTIKVFTDGAYSRGEISSVVAYSKYATAMAACFFAFATMIKRGASVFAREFNKLMLVFTLFSIVSIAMQAISQHIAITVYVELIKFVMPILLAYCMLNAIDEAVVYRCMEAILVISFLGYLYDLAHMGVSVLSIFQSDFSRSESTTEHAGLSDMSLMLSFFFLYFRKDRWPAILSVFFCLLTFKRLAMLFVIMASLIAIFAPQRMNMHISKGFLRICKILTLAAVALWFWMLLPGQEKLFINIFDMTPFDFTSGRSGIMRWLLDSGFQSYGFGSTNDTVKALFKVPFEMDLVKIAIELTPLALIVFVWEFWDVAGDKFWGFLIVGFYVLNMITSDCLNSNFGFTLGYTVIGLVSYSHHSTKPLCEKPALLDGERTSL